MDELDYLVESRPNSEFWYACLQEADNYSVHQQIIGAGQRPARDAEGSGRGRPCPSVQPPARGAAVTARWGRQAPRGHFRLLFKDGE